MLLLNQTNMLIELFEEIRETMFSKAIDDANELSVETNIDMVFLIKLSDHRKNSLTRIQVIKVSYF